MLIVISLVGFPHGSYILRCTKLMSLLLSFPCCDFFFLSQTLSIKRKLNILATQYLILSAFKYEDLVGRFC
jgi:hypothetical protein